tara:strand:- start:28961 stop:29905 length:945 start_codon:yes stop_codon:yes gene_type:complete
MTHFAGFDFIILFFVLGGFASWINSDLEIPEPISKFLSIFLLLALGLKGGHEVQSADNLTGFTTTLSLGIVSCVALPIVMFYLLKNKLSIGNAAAISASYGSVSAVTFITAQGLLTNKGMIFSGFMVAIMALMEIPGILIGAYLYKKHTKSLAFGKSIFLNILSAKSVILLLGGFIIGLLMNDKTWLGVSPMFQDLFKGALAFFLLDLGIAAQRRIREAWTFKRVILPIAILFPLFWGTVFLLLGHAAGVAQGDLVLLGTLVGSASYIAAPAAMRSLIVDSNPSLYLALPLALTFPFNLAVGIPFYIELSSWLA